jgi:hypothetical protein
MNTHREAGKIDCSSCSGCTMRDELGEDSGTDPLLSGWRLGMVSAGLFLGPVFLAIAGAACCGDGEGVQFLGATAGLGMGMTGSVVVGKLLHRTGKSRPGESER